MNFLYFTRGKTGKTGSKLSKYLSIRTNRSLERGLVRSSSVSSLIRWGNSECLGECPDRVLNKAQAIDNSANKLKALKIMKEEGVSVPWFTDNRDEAQELCDYKDKSVVGRTTYHQGGSGFNRTDLPEDDYTSSHWLELINVVKEWRVHVFQGEVIGVSRKTDEDVGWRITNRYCRNHTNGWRFIKCDLDLVQQRLKDLGVEAVKALGLDFGAVDIILSDGTESTSMGSKKYYVLEVNSAPSLEEGSTIISKYIERFKQWLY